MDRQALQSIIAIVTERSGVRLVDADLYRAESRLSALVEQRRFNGGAELAAALQQEGQDELFDEVFDAVRNSETSFFRDPEVFSHLIGWILPELAAKSAATRSSLQILSIGCSDGREIYSLAIALIGLKPMPRSVVIRACDFSAAAVMQATSGIYSHYQAQVGLAARDLTKHFMPRGESWQAKEDLRSSLHFFRHNFRQGLPESVPCDIIFCRYVLENWSPERKASALASLMSGLAPGGVLCLGRGEAQGAAELATLDQKAADLGIYRQPDQPRN